MIDITPKSPPENRFLKAIDRERGYPLKQEAAVFAHPRGVRVLTQPDGNQFKVSIPTAIINWWVVPFLLIPAFFLVILPIGVGLSFVAPSWDRGGYFNPLPVLIALGIVVALSWITWRLCFPRIVIEATREGVTVGKYKFDWRALGGFRIGYTAGGVERENTQGLFQGMVLQYGSYGFDLPYMVRKYYAAYYVVWLNEMLATIGANDKTGANDPQSGFKKSMF